MKIDKGLIKVKISMNEKRVKIMQVSGVTSDERGKKLRNGGTEL